MHYRLLLSYLITLCVFPVNAQEIGDFYNGRWALHLPGGAGWLEVHDNQGVMDASLLWYGGSVLPVASVNISDNSLTVTRIQPVNRSLNDGSSRRFTVTSTLTFTPDGDRLKGTAHLPNHSGIGTQVIEFMAERIPELPDSPDLSQVIYGDPVNLFNGIDLTGWSLTNDQQVNGFKAEDGLLVNDPVQPDEDHHIHYGNLRTDATFEDFRLTLEVNVPEGSNSGVYLRGIYEIQVADTYGRDLNRHHMGALYSRIQPSINAEKPAGEWQLLDITLYHRHLTVILNGSTIIDNQPVVGVTGGALTADESLPGPIYLQGDHGRILYRNLILTPIL